MFSFYVHDVEDIKKYQGGAAFMAARDRISNFTSVPFIYGKRVGM